MPPIPRADLGDAPRALGDDEEVDHHQHGEDDGADGEVVAHHEMPEGLDHAPRAAGAVVALGQDEARARDVQRKAERGDDEQDGRERAEVQRAAHEDRQRQDHQRSRERQREEHVEQPGRHRQDEDPDDAQHAEAEQARPRPRAVEHAARRGYRVAERDHAATHRSAPACCAGSGSSCRGSSRPACGCRSNARASP